MLLSWGRFHRAARGCPTVVLRQPVVRNSQAAMPPRCPVLRGTPAVSSSTSYAALRAAYRSRDRMSGLRGEVLSFFLQRGRRLLAQLGRGPSLPPVRRLVKADAAARPGGRFRWTAIAREAPRGELPLSGVAGPGPDRRTHSVAFLPPGRGSAFAETLWNIWPALPSVTLF